MSVPDLSALAASVFNSYPADILTLNALCDQTEADRAAFGEDDPRVQAGETKVNNLKGLFTRRIAWACYQQDQRFGLRKKSSGAHAVRPSDGMPLSTDVLMWKDTGEIGDVMSDRNVSWNWNPADTQPLDQWVLPLPEGEVPAPVPVPTPTPTPTPAPPMNDHEARITQLERDNRDQALALSACRVDIEHLAQRCLALENKPTPVVTLPELVVEGKTSTMWGHQHTVNLAVKRKQ